MKCESINCNNKIHTDKNCNLIIDEINFNCDYILVFILKHSKEYNTQTIIKENRLLQVMFKNIKDGFYTICKLTIPLNEAKPYYYKNGNFYHNAKEVYLLEILNTNPEITKIHPEYFYYFSTCNLKKCFIKICLDIFSLSTSICNKNSIDSTLTYKRDLLWSALNVIKYMVEMDLLEEAQKLLDLIVGCNGLCPLSGNEECGCNK